ncbi:hypothetical protein PFICI_02408 [Pestalotiopsis fici W106-1]|uniref:Uncharacterized protein n=1 Tax=Pestalotiopsis fici (strain W106-1 / CGMCC3.15140) TaxID=1229662 RepID=W3XE63_PESFW|nr:uncharacterized protein PFICI_02408 [Pestalotiopsis fici W106-1]ETS84383.1 hypothetical protein PFICI_02408 [Pestalotiopsis fici W106-1]
MTSINAVFESVAQTLTVWTRLNGDPNYSEPILGQAFHRATCIQASWAWLALPAITASLTLLVLALTVFATHRSELPVWKSSPLALLLHGPGGMDWVDEAMVVHPRPRENKADLRTENGMRTMAARIWVSLEDGDAALRLRQVGSRRDSLP